jgi:hypothetical protein
MKVSDLKKALESMNDDDYIYAPLFTSKATFLAMNDDFDTDALCNEEWADIVIEAEDKDDDWFVQGQDILRQVAHRSSASPFYEGEDPNEEARRDYYTHENLGIPTMMEMNGRYN